MRVCLVCGSFPPRQCGVGDYTWHLANALLRAGLDVEVITTRGLRGPAGEAFTGMIHDVVSRWSLRALGNVRARLRRSRPEVVHVQYQTALYGMHPAVNLLPLLLRLSARRPRIVTTFHDLRVPYLFPKAGRLRTLANSALLRYSDGVVLTNDEDALSVAGEASPSDRFVRIPIGSNIRRMVPPGYRRETWRASHGIDATDFVIAYFGFLNDSKGVDNLLRAIARLRETVPARLLLVGGGAGEADPTNEHYAAHLARLIDELHLPAAVSRTGYTSPIDISAALLSADACALPFRDGASLRRGSLLAALEHGLPLVTTRPRAGNRELRHEENCLLVPADDYEALSLALGRLARDPRLAQGLGRKAQEVSQLFGWDGIAAQTLQFYRRLGAKG